ncbi:hypothetical protein ACO0QE_002623 [Hanseniaspora vineae]
MTSNKINSKSNSQIDQENDKYIQDTFDKKRPITENTDDTIKIATRIESFSSDDEGEGEGEGEGEDENSAKVFGSEEDNKTTGKLNTSNDKETRPKRTESFLNNDGIDELKPRQRKERVSSLSLTDQVFNNLQMSSSGAGIAGSRRSSAISINSNLASNNNSNIDSLVSPRQSQSSRRPSISFNSNFSNTNSTNTTNNNTTAGTGFNNPFNADKQDALVDEPAAPEDKSKMFTLDDDNDDNENDNEDLEGRALSNGSVGSGTLKRNSSLNGARRGSMKVSRSSSISHHKLHNQRKTIIDHERVASYAFAFDIDGVLIRGKETIPEAIKAMDLLNGNNKYNIKVPYIFITNGGGNDEKLRCQNLSKRLHCDIQVDQIIQGHTPMKSLVGIYDNVLVVGGIEDNCRKIAENYGFKNVYIPFDILNWNPNVTPYYKLTDEEKKFCKKDVDFSKTKIDAILVFADSRNWNVDQQIILELLMSKNGTMGTSDAPDFDKGPELYFAHSDFVWATDYKLNRYGMGALQISIAALYQESTGKALKVNRFGKPQRGTFRFAEKVLSNWRRETLENEFEQLRMNSVSSASGAPEESDIARTKSHPFLSPRNSVAEEAIAEDPVAEEEEETAADTHGSQSNKTAASGSVSSSASSQIGQMESDPDNDDGIFFEGYSNELILPPASTVYFVGDTPESDIRFANSHDASWFSILVKTGVYQDGSIPKYKPKKIVNTVLDAVKFAMDREQAKELEEWNAQFDD